MGAMPAKIAAIETVPIRTHTALPISISSFDTVFCIENDSLLLSNALRLPVMLFYSFGLVVSLLCALFFDIISQSRLMMMLI